MPKIICFLSPKGGCGATFVCGGVAYSLAKYGKKVLALDMCFEKGTLDYVLGFQNDYVYTFEDVADGMCTLCEALISRDNLNYMKYAYEYNHNLPVISDTIFRDTDFDYILLDYPAYISDFSGFDLQSTNEIIIVTDPQLSSQKVCDTYLSHNGFSNASLVVNKIKPSYITAGIQMTIDEILDTLSVPLRGLVPWSMACEMILKDGISTQENDDCLYKAFSNIAMRLDGERIAAMDFDKVNDIFKSHRKIMKGRT